MELFRSDYGWPKQSLFVELFRSDYDWPKQSLFVELFRSDYGWPKQSLFGRSTSAGRAVTQFCWRLAITVTLWTSKMSIPSSYLSSTATAIAVIRWTSNMSMPSSYSRAVAAACPLAVIVISPGCCSHGSPSTCMGALPPNSLIWKYSYVRSVKRGT